jgi:uncharacterized protein YkwD
VKRSAQLAIVCLLAAATAHGQANIAEQYLIAAANQERAQIGAGPLTVDPELTAAALAHARQMAERQDISHQFAGEAGLLERTKAATYGFDAVAENVAFAPTVPMIHSGWMNSPGHRTNLLNPKYNTIGVAVLVNGNEIYAVEDFGHKAGVATPAAAPSLRYAKPIATPEPTPTRLPQPVTESHIAARIGSDEHYLLDQVNRERAQIKLPPVHWDEALARAAQTHAAIMAEHRSISHQFSGEPELSIRGANAGAHFSFISENVAEGPSAAQLHTAWMNSTGHRENLLDAKVDAVGIAVIMRDHQLYAVQDFARTTRSLTLDQQEASVASLLPNLDIDPDPGDARRTCARESGYRGPRQPAFIMRYTAASLDTLPSEIQPRLATGRYHHAAIGACTPEGTPFTTYKIAILLYP